MVKAIIEKIINCPSPGFSPLQGTDAMICDFVEVYICQPRTDISCVVVLLW